MTNLPQSLGIAYETIAPRATPSLLFPKMIAFGRVLLAAMHESRRRQAQAELVRHRDLMDRARNPHP